MRRIKWGILILSGLMLLSACGKEEPVPEAQTEIVVPMLTEAPTTEAPAVAETVPIIAPETEAATETGETQETVPAAEETAEPTEMAPAGVSGKIVNTETVNVRQGPSIHTQVVKKLHRNDAVTVTEKVVVDSVGWGHTEDGWVCMDYLSLEGSVPERPGTLGVVYHTDKVNIRKEPSLGGEIVGSFQRNDLIQVLETKGKWGRTEKGWISLDYVQLQEASAPQQESAGKGEYAPQQQSATGGDYDPQDSQPGLNDYTAPSEGVYPGNGSFTGPESLHPAQKTCQHPSWHIWKHVDDKVIENKVYICQCGHEEVNLPGWELHAAINKEDAENHSTYTVKDLGDKIIPGGNYWECDECGVVERLPLGQKP